MGVMLQANMGIHKLSFVSGVTLDWSNWISICELLIWLSSPFVQTCCSDRAQHTALTMLRFSRERRKVKSTHNSLRVSKNTHFKLHKYNIRSTMIKMYYFVWYPCCSDWEMRHCEVLLQETNVHTHRIAEAAFCWMTFESVSFTS